MKTRIQTRLKALLAAALLTTSFSAFAQETPENYVGYPQLFVGLQGGVQETGTHYYNNWKLFTPTASASVGVHFTPVIGARIHMNGFWNKSGVRDNETSIDTKFKYKYITTDLDAMVNIINLFSKNNYRPWNFYLIGGIGLNYAWGNDSDEFPELAQYVTASNSKSRLSHNFRVGGMFDVRVARNWSVNLELDANSLSDRFNSKVCGDDDWQFTAQIGVTYRIPLRKNSTVDDYDIWHRFRKNRNEHKDDIDPSLVDLTKEVNDPIAKVDDTPVVTVPDSITVEKPVNITRNIFFGLRETEVSATEKTKLTEVVTWLKKHPEAKVTVTGYADKGTGTAESNARYAKQRADIVTKELVKKGVNASRITTTSKGDTIQPFPTDNDKNRVTIVVADGTETVKEAKK